jgi:hypothetical protein
MNDRMRLRSQTKSPVLRGRVGLLDRAQEGGAVLITAPTLSQRKSGEGVDGGSWIGMRLATAPAFRADATPLVDQKGVTE